MTKKLWILTVAGAMALPQIGMAQFGPKPAQPQQPGKPQPPVVVVKPGQPQPAKPQPAPAVKPAPKPQPAPVVKPAPQPPPKPQPAVVVKPVTPPPPAKPQPAVVVKPVTPPPPAKPQPAVVVKPAAPLPAPPKPAPAPVPVVVYRPGHKNHPLQPPKERDHYKDWKPLHHKKFYAIAEAPEFLQVSMRVGQEVEIKLEEKIGDGLKWFARCDASMVDIDIDHERPRWYSFSRTAYSEVEIEARRPGNTMVELVYARPGEWDLGNPPQKVLQIFVHIE